MNKTKLITLRVTEKEYETIKKKATKSGISLSRFVAFSALGKNVVSVNGLPEVAKQLIKIGTNLNQLVMLCHQGRITCPDLSLTRKELNNIWQLFSFLTDPTKPLQD
ncbi:plasmid mobilization protein [Sporosalibacterium faouarense]|uniref:plasmid mobilization protein n=1 Tax=Sporosalibacterium faouarense TaxID=516123 RepID=UPI00192C0C74